MKNRIVRVRLSLGLILVGVSVGSARANDWPQWRGPNRDGVNGEKGLLQQWPQGGPALAWRTTEAGVGFSSVSVAKGRVLTLGDSGGGARFRAFDERSGRTLWISDPIGRPGGGPPGTRSTPAVDGELVYGLGQFGDVACVEAATGKLRWKKSLTKDFGGSVPNWEYSESPLVDGDKVLCTPGGSKGAVVALNKKTGEVLWQSAAFTDEAHHSSIIAADLGGRRQYIQLTPQSVAGLATEDGAVLWRAPRRGRTAVVPTPICGNEDVFVTSGYGVGCNLFKVTKSASGFEARQVYANKNLDNHHGGVIRIGEHIYGHSDSRGWVCLEMKTGKVVWSNQGVGKGAMACADGHFYLRSEDSGRGTIALIDVTPAGYRERGRFNQPDLSGKETWAHPVVSNGRLYIRDQALLLCYDVKAK
jgi:outer membrane protein assembly factor BamB